MKDYDITIKQGEKAFNIKIDESALNDIPNILGYAMFKAKEYFDDDDITGVIKVSPEALKGFEEIENDNLKELSKKKIY